MRRFYKDYDGQVKEIDVLVDDGSHPAYHDPNLRYCRPDGFIYRPPVVSSRSDSVEFEGFQLYATRDEAARAATPSPIAVPDPNVRN